MQKEALDPSFLDQLRVVLARGDHRKLEQLFRLSRPTLYKAASGAEIQCSTAVMIRLCLSSLGEPVAKSSTPSNAESIAAREIQKGLATIDAAMKNLEKARGLSELAEKPVPLPIGRQIQRSKRKK
jgi:hypothetical protein